MPTNLSLSTIEVDTLVDENDGNLSASDVSLREALAAVGIGGTITFANSLQREDAGFGVGVLGLSLGALKIQKSLQVEGLGKEQLTIDAGGESSVFVIDDGDRDTISDVVIDGLSITGGTTQNGGIFSREKLTVTNSSVSGNSVGIVADTTYSEDDSVVGDALVVVNSVVSGNVGAGISLRYQPIEYSQSYLYNFDAEGRSSITVTNSTVENNGSRGISRFADGIYLPYSYNGPLYVAKPGGISVIGSTISGNSVGVFTRDNLQGTSVTVTDSSITNNRSSGVDVGSEVGRNFATIANSTISGNQGNGVDVQGPISVGRESYFPEGVLTVENSVVSENKGSALSAFEVSVTSSVLADNGEAGIFANGAAVFESSITGNGGVGISATYDMGVRQSTIAQNAGGAISLQADYSYHAGTDLSIDNSTIAGNGSSKATVGGIFVSPNTRFGGDVSSKVNISSTTISGNTGTEVGGILFEDSNYPSNSIEYTIRDTIVAGNIGPTSDISGGLTGGGFNLVGDGTDATGLADTDLVGSEEQPIDPLLGILQDNGGPTFTQALLPNSPAIDAGNPNSNSTEFDQRGNGFSRLVDGDGDGRSRIDIGSIEAAKTVTPVFHILNGDKGSNRLFGAGGRDLISGFRGFDTLKGRGGDDILFGGAGKDRLLGDGGNDILVGGIGDDKLRGGGGNDTFVYESIFEGKDIILDFRIGRDLIDLSAIFESARYDSTTPFEDYIRLGKAGPNTRLEVLNANASRGGREIFREIAVIRHVSPTAFDESSFVL